uniref:Uncharacterized protein n=1 Tax=Ciona savignyi TaxID=51511 RepID=H2Z064_CIOSA
MNNVTPSMIKERIRLIKPTRPQAPTEYNLQYKRWPLRPFTYDTFRVDKKTLKRDIPKEKETKSAEDAETVNTFSSAYPCSTQSEQQSEDSSKLSVPSQYEEDKTDNVLSSALHTSTAKMHVRTNQSKMGKKQSACRPNTTLGTRSGQNADSTMKKLEKDFSNKLRYLTAYSNIASTKGTSSSSSKAVKKHRRREAWVREGNTSSPSEKLPINKERTTATQEHQTNNSPPKLPKNDKLRIGDLC